MQYARNLYLQLLNILKVFSVIRDYIFVSNYLLSYSCKRNLPGSGLTMTCYGPWNMSRSDVCAMAAQSFQSHHAVLSKFFFASATRISGPKQQVLL